MPTIATSLPAHFRRSGVCIRVLVCLQGLFGTLAFMCKCLFGISAIPALLPALLLIAGVAETYDPNRAVSPIL